MCSLYQHTLLSTYWWGRKDRKGRELWVALSFPFLLGHHFQCKYVVDRCREVAWGRKDMSDRVPSMPFLSLLETSCGWSERHDLLWLLAPPVDSATTFTLTLSSFWISWTSVHCCLLGFSTRAVLPARHTRGAAQNTGVHTAHFSSAHLNTDSKVKLLRISKWQQQSIKPNAGAFWAQCPV